MIHTHFFSHHVGELHSDRFSAPHCRKWFTSGQSFKIVRWCIILKRGVRVKKGLWVVDLAIFAFLLTNRSIIYYHGWAERRTDIHFRPPTMGFYLFGSVTTVSSLLVSLGRPKPHFAQLSLNPRSLTYCEWFWVCLSSFEWKLESKESSADFLEQLTRIAVVLIGLSTATI